MIPHQPSVRQLDAVAELVQSIRPTWRKTEILDELRAALDNRVAAEILTLAVGAARYALTARHLHVQGLADRGEHWANWGFERAGRARVDAASARCGLCGHVHAIPNPAMRPDELCPPPDDQIPTSVTGHAQAAKDAIRSANQ